MSEATVRAAIKTILESVSGIGAVNDYRRTSRSLAKVLETQRQYRKVNGWTIYREKMPTRRDSTHTVRKSHHFKIDGIYELNDADATEKTFQALIDTIFTTFLTDQTLGGLCIDTDPLQVLIIDAEDLGGTLFHTVEMLLVCHERESYTYS